MKEWIFFFMIIFAFISMSDSHLYSSLDNINIPEMSKISDLPLESLLNYINLDQNLEEESNDLLEHIHMLRGQHNLENIMGTFVNKVKYLKDEIVNKVVDAAMDVVNVNKEVLADMIKVFKDVTKNVKNGAQIVEIVEVTYDIVLYTNITLNNLYKNNPNYEKEADDIYKKITDEISHAEKILRNNENKEKDLRLYFDEINRQMYSLESDLKVIVQKAKEIRKAMVEIIQLKPMLEAKFKHTKIQKIRMCECDCCQDCCSGYSTCMKWCCCWCCILCGRCCCNDCCDT